MKKMLCPSGHTLPRDGCTPLYCVGEKAEKKKAKVLALPSPKPPKVTKADRKKAAKAIATLDLVPHKDGPVEEQLAQMDEEAIEKAKAQLQKRIADLEMRKRLLKMPEGLTGAAAEEYAQTKAVDLLPLAMLETEFQLLYGDDKQRKEAARDVQGMNGLLNRADKGNIAPTIILNLTAGDSIAAPWLVRTDEKIAKREDSGTPAGQAPATANK